MWSMHRLRDVQSMPDAHNIAYTNIPLCPHQDLAYYESKPGLHVLYCLKNEGVKGGESVLVHAMACSGSVFAPSCTYYVGDTL
jgi:Taurine catabolism dioxygenase TauD, TfdA family